MIDFDKITEKSSAIPFYQYIYKQIKAVLSATGPLSFNDLLRLVGGGEKRLARLLYQMELAGETTFAQGKLALTAGGKQPAVSAGLCGNCHGKRVENGEQYSQLLGFMRQINQNRPAVNFSFDQKPVSLETSVSRALYVALRGDAVGKKILFIGDDDLSSLALAKLGLAKEIVVVDIDNSLVEFINNQSRIHQLAVKAIKFDLLTGQPDLPKDFDVFLADPTPELAPIATFVNQGWNFLGLGGGVGYLSIDPSYKDRDISMQRWLIEKGILMTEIIPSFNEYQYNDSLVDDDSRQLINRYTNGMPEIAFCESLYRLQLPPKKVTD